MNKKIKSVVGSILMFIILSLLSGCVNNYQAVHSFEIADVKSIEFTEGKFIKNIDRYEDIKLIQDLFNKIHSEVVSDDVVLDGWKYEFKVINENKKLVNKIVIYKDYLSYNNEIYSYSYQNNLYNKLHELYENLEYDEIIEKEIQENIDTDKKNREKLLINEAMKGVWFKDNQEFFYFTSDYLIQNRYKFKYKIKETGSRYIYLTAFKKSRSSSKEKELFDLYIEIDRTRNNMRLKKIVNQLWSSPLIYEENAIYINPDNYILGSFDSSFFSNENEKEVY